MTHYRLALGWRILTWIFLPPLLAGGVFMAVIPFLQADFDWVLVAILFPMGLGLTGLCLYAIAELIVGYHALDDQRIVQRSPLGTKTLLLSEVKGIRRDKSYTYLVPKDPKMKRIKISSYTGKYRELSGRLQQRFDDLDIVEAVKEEEQILANEEFGITQQAREGRLAEARRWAKYVNFAGIGALVWVYILPEPYTVSIVVSIAMPLVALFIAYMFRGLIRLDYRKNSAYPNVAMGLIMPGAGLLVRGMADFNILDYGGIWKCGAMLTVTMFVVLLMATTEFKLKSTRDQFSVAVFGFLMAVYSFGTLIVVNCLFDRSEPQVFEATIVDKSHTSGTKSTTYHLKLAPWGPRTEAENVTVTDDQYGAAEVNDVVNVYLHPGLIGTPWFWVEVEK